MANLNTIDELSTIALLERKPSISRDLFSRYWRDVHGVMAARIPGFWAYVQHHVTPLVDLGSTTVEPFEGIAVVRFANEDHRAGLLNSAVTPHIHRDERNVFRRALLYSLDADETLRTAPDVDENMPSWFVVVPRGCNATALAEVVRQQGAAAVELFDLRRADPAGWNDVDASEAGASRLFDAVLKVWGEEVDAFPALSAVVSASQGQCACYRVDERYEMVSRGRPTQIGLRGLDAVRTIMEAGADNQLQAEVVRAVYGAFAG